MMVMRIKQTNCTIHVKFVNDLIRPQSFQLDVSLPLISEFNGAYTIELKQEQDKYIPYMIYILSRFTSEYMVIFQQSKE